MLSKLIALALGVAVGCIIATPFLLLDVIRLLRKLIAGKEPPDV